MPGAVWREGLREIKRLDETVRLIQSSASVKDDLDRHSECIGKALSSPFVGEIDESRMCLLKDYKKEIDGRLKEFTNRGGAQEAGG